MTGIDESTVPIIKYIVGETQNICRLCFRESANVDFLEQHFTVESNYFAGVVTFQDIFKELEAPTDFSLPHRLCEECADLSIKAFLFRQLSQNSYFKWIENVKRFEKTFEQNVSLSSSANTAYFLIQMNKDVILTSQKCHKDNNKGAVLHKIKGLLKEQKRKKELERQKKQVNDNNRNKKHQCTHCLKLFQTKASLSMHKDRIHKPKTLQCSECSKKFSSEKILRYHHASFHSPGTCKHCLIKFETKRELSIHMSTHDLNFCPLCNKEFKNKVVLKSHMKICGQNQTQISVYCDICNKGYIRKNSLRSHLITEHGFGQTYICKWCNKKYDAVSKLKNHEVKHTRERKFSCEMCGGQFVTKAALVYHTRIHTGEKPFPCDLCTESFLSASRRMEHKRRKHFAPNYPCSMCESKFNSRFEVNKHEARHRNPQSRLYMSENDGHKTSKLEVNKHEVRHENPQSRLYMSANDGHKTSLPIKPVRHIVYF